MGNIESLDDLKGSGELRELIMKAIDYTVTTETRSQEEITSVKKVDVKAQQIASNTITSGGGVIIGNKNKPVKFTQKTNLKSVVRTLYASNYLKKQSEPIVQMVSADIMDLTTENANEKELPNWYDAKYVMSLLGFDCEDAKFDFEAKGIKYLVNIGEDNRETIRQRNIEIFENEQTNQVSHQEHNEKYASLRPEYLKLQDERSRIQDEINKLAKLYGADVYSLECSARAFKNTCNMLIFQTTADKLFQKYAEEKLISKDTGCLKFNTVIDKLYDAVKSDAVYIKGFEYVKSKVRAYFKSTFPKSKWEDSKYNELTLIDYLGGFDNLSYISGLKEKKDVTDAELTLFKPKLVAFFEGYNEFQESAILTALYEISKHVDDIDKLIKVDDKDKAKKQAEELRSRYQSLLYNLTQYHTKMLEIEDIYNQNKETYEKIKELKKHLEPYDARLNTKTAVNALKWYDYYDTEIINQKLLDKVTADVAIKKMAYDALAATPEQQADLQELQSVQADVFFAKCDVQMYEDLIINSVSYQHNYAKVVEKMQNAQSPYIGELNQIKASSDYTTKYDEITKDMTEAEKAYITPAQVVYQTKNEELIKKYLDYDTKTNAWWSENFDVAKIVHLEFDNDFAKNHSGNINLMRENYNKYLSSYDNYNVKLALQDEAQAAWIDKYGEQWENVSAAASAWVTMKTQQKRISTILKNYNNAINPEYSFISFDTLYQYLAAGYAQKIRDKVTNFNTLSKNYRENITEAATMYASNYIEVEGKFKGALNVKQSNTAVQELDASVTKVQKQIDELNKRSAANASKRSSLTVIKGNDVPKPSNVVEVVDINTTPKKSNTSESDEIMSIIIIGLIVLAIVIMGIVGLSLYKKKKRLQQIANIQS